MALSIKSYGPAMFWKVDFFVCIRRQSTFYDFLDNIANRFNFSEANNSATCYLYCVGKHRITGTFAISFEKHSSRGKFLNKPEDQLLRRDEHTFRVFSPLVIAEIT